MEEKKEKLCKGRVILSESECGAREEDFFGVA